MLGDDLSTSATGFPPPFRIFAEQRLLQYCTNEIGALVFRAGGIPAALIGNPIRLVSLDDGLYGTGSNKILNWSGGSSSLLELNCTEKYVALSSGSSLSIYDLQKNTILRELHDHDAKVNGVTWHRESPWQLASVGADCTLRLWDLRSHPAQFSLRRSSKSYRTLEFSPDCNYIACAGELISIFDLSMTRDSYPNILHMPCNSPATNLCFNPAECLLATTCDDRAIRFFDIDTGECVTQSPAFDSTIGPIVFSPDGRFLIVSTGKQISCIRWEPFELLSQIIYPHQIQIPFQNSTFSSVQSHILESDRPQINLLDIRIEKDKLYQLAVVCPDLTKIGNACLVSLPLDHLEKCGVVSMSQAPLDTFSAESREESIPSCPTADSPGRHLGPTAAEEEELDPEEEEENKTSPDSVLSPTVHMLDSLVITGTDHQIPRTEAPPFSAPAPNRRQPPILKRRGSSYEIGDADKATGSKAAVTAGGDSENRIRRNRHRDGNGSVAPVPRRPDKLRIVQQPSPSDPNNNGKSSSKLFIRRGSSLNDVAKSPLSPTTNNSMNMPISSVAQTKRKARTSIFTSSLGSSSNTTSNCTTSNKGGGWNKAEDAAANNQDEDLTDFMQICPKLQTHLTKIKADLENLRRSATKESGGKGIALHLVEKSSRFEQPHLLAKLIADYMKDSTYYNMDLNLAFLRRIDVLLMFGRNVDYIKIALDFVHMVVTSFGDSIKNGLLSKESIGTDVAAEQRFERSLKCKNALQQIQFNMPFYIERMDSSQRRRLEFTIVPEINSIMAACPTQPPATGNTTI